MYENELEVYMKRLVNKILDEREMSLKEDDAKQIVNAIMPELDELISKRVKEHFVTIADLIKNKFV